MTDTRIATVALAGLRAMLEQDLRVVRDAAGTHDAEALASFERGYRLALDSVVSWSRGYTQSLVQSGTVDPDDDTVRLILRRTDR